MKIKFQSKLTNKIHICDVEDIHDFAKTYDPKEYEILSIEREIKDVFLQDLHLEQMEQM